jgi:TonB family protein
MTLALYSAQLPAQAAHPMHAERASQPDLTNHSTLVTMAEWTKRMHRVLAHEIRYPSPILGWEAGTGMVRVKFNCSESGRPDKVSLLKTSGNMMLDRAGLIAVRRMASLHPLPAGFKPTQKFEAIIVYAKDSSDPHLASMIKEQERRNAWYHDPLTASRQPRGDAEVAVIG